MCTIKRITYEEVHYSGQEPSFEERYELDHGNVLPSVSNEELERYVLHLEEQLYIANRILESREISLTHSEKFFKELSES